MHKHADKRILPYTAQQMFDLVKDVEAYPDFLPWCDGLRIKKRMEKEIIADMLVGFKGVSEKFTSQVYFDEEKKAITVQYKDGPFKSLINTWNFSDIEAGCELNFYIEFEFKNKMLDMMIAPAFNTVVKKMVKAFFDRAHEIYG